MQPTQEDWAMDWIQFFKNSLPDQALVLERLPSEEPVLYQLKASNIPVKDKVEFARTPDDFTNAATSTLLNVLADPSIHNVQDYFQDSSFPWNFVFTSAEKQNILQKIRIL